MAVVAAAAIPAAALAALPGKNTSFEAHDHSTKGKNWHVQVQVGKDPHAAEFLVVYSEQCDVDIAEENVPIADDGTLTASGTTKGGGTWKVDAKFPESDHFTGTAQVVKGSCDTGPLTFDVMEGEEGDGHTDHDHGDAGGGGAGGHHHNHGPKFPAIDQATAAQRAQAERLRIEVRHSANTRFRTYRAARALNFKRFARKWKRPVIFHLRSSTYDKDKRIFDAKRPESLVYWWPRHGQPILLGFMFRVPTGDRPPFAGPIPIYHQHPNRYGKLGDNQMTHVWRTGGLKSAWSNCLPVEQLEKALPKFRYEKPRSGVSGPESMPC
ncbi:MAG TPA: hypothetical protein VF533_03170 [Solirubrobacteraceae bacterium]